MPVMGDLLRLRETSAPCRWGRSCPVQDIVCTQQNCGIVASTVCWMGASRAETCTFFVSMCRRFLAACSSQSRWCLY